MRFVDNKFIVPQSVAAGPPMDVGDMTELEALASGTFSATMDIEVSLDGSVWTVAVNNISAPSLAPLPVNGLAKYARVNVTVYNSGQPVVRLYGRTTRDG